jgi:hypothetical protein
MRIQISVSTAFFRVPSSETAQEGLDKGKMGLRGDQIYSLRISLLAYHNFDPKYGEITLLRNSCNLIPTYTASQLIRQFFFIGKCLKNLRMRKTWIAYRLIYE